MPLFKIARTVQAWTGFGIIGACDVDCYFVPSPEYKRVFAIWFNRDAYTLYFNTEWDYLNRETFK